MATQPGLHPAALSATGAQSTPRRLRLRAAAFTLVVFAVVIFLAYFAVVRPWHVRFGATDAEVSMALPGDASIPANSLISTRAITIKASADEVWRWMIQIGQGRAGFYSYDWLEKLLGTNMQNADAIQPELQNLQVGDRIYMQDMGPYSTVTQVDPGRSFALGGWSFYLSPVDANTTRLIVRSHTDPIDNIFEQVYTYTVFEPAHFLMEYGMMQGIKQRAEGS
jgi:hypothetical protein